MTRPRNFNAARRAAEAVPLPGYIPALFDEIQTKHFERFRLRVVAMLEADENASLMRLLMSLHRCQRYYTGRLGEEEADVLIYHRGLIERLGYSNQEYGRGGADFIVDGECLREARQPYGDALAEILYHAATVGHSHMYWARRNLPEGWWGHPRPLPTRGNQP